MLEKSLQLCAYAFAAEEYDNGHDIIDGFKVFIDNAILSLCENGKCTFSFLALHNQINQLYQVHMPKATLKSYINKIYHANNNLSMKDNKIEVTNSYIEMLREKVRNELEGEIDDLFISFRSFLEKNKLYMSIDEIKSSFCHYLYNSCFELAMFIDKDVRPETPNGTDSLFMTLLCDYVIECKEHNCKLYNSFLQIYSGATQATLLSFQDSQLRCLTSDDMHVNTVILDTNFIMRVLDIQTELEGQMAQETMDMLRDIKANLIVLSVSIEEVQKSIKNYLNDTAVYTQKTANYYRNKSIRMSGFAAAAQRGVSRKNFLDLSKYDSLVERLESIPKLKVIEVVDDEIPVKDSDVHDLILSKGDDWYGDKQAKHDIQLINYCKKSRPKRIRYFEKAEAWVLTNDNKLTYWNQSQTTDYQECITEAQLSNLFWLKRIKPQNNGLVNTITSLATGRYINPSSLVNFIHKIEIYANQTPEMADYVSIVYASNSLTTQNLIDVETGKVELDVLISKKVAEKQQKDVAAASELEKSKNINETQQKELLKMQVERDIADLETKMAVKGNEITELEKCRTVANTKLTTLRQLEKCYKRASKYAAFVAFIIFAIGVCLIGHFTLYFVCKLLPTEQYDVIIGAISLLIGVLTILPMGYFLSKFAFGESMDRAKFLKEILDKLEGWFAKRIKANRIIDCDVPKEQIDVEMDHFLKIISDAKSEDDKLYNDIVEIKMQIVTKKNVLQYSNTA